MILENGSSDVQRNQADLRGLGTCGGRARGYRCRC